MTVFLEEHGPDEGLVGFQRVSLSAGHNENWLQEKLFDHPTLVPMVEMFGHGEALMPLCREYPLRYGSSNVFVDLLGVSPTGRLVLIECKLWRNPGARREVVAQLFEYASLMGRLTYSDLEAKLKQVRGLTGENPMFKAVSEAFPELDEASFVDAVNESLRRGDFLLAIAGDGIRSDLHALKNLLANQGGILARLALLEIRLFRDANGRTLLVPNVPVQTELVRREVFVGVGREASTSDPFIPPRADEMVVGKEGVDSGTTGSSSYGPNRPFWTRFINEVRFDHPDQPPPRHGGNNWVRMAMPGPLSNGLVAFREANHTAALMVKFKGPEGRNLMQTLLEDQSALESELGHSVRFNIKDVTEDSDRVVAVLLVEYKPHEGPEMESEQMTWLLKMANAMVNALRPRLAATTA
ncbi:hypothetical protein LJ655_08865 [Paraburkholderia sp. MMS20-SJTN17]|uniref:DUF4268 domain-containing protein n=1 Tax=Paraburkholderia translucens TaxID=2886945 RepID=A0ABS8KBG9_9BURK|nr:hypothetical protein [Paraburkholderia sp. MMS20-SJTN17]MCC8402002.1 hypothetical protein [Paraburkholderia sp. MMS20-SJTN17]